MLKSGEVNLTSSYDSLKKYDLPADFKYILIDRIMPLDYKLSNWDDFILTLHGLSRFFSISDVKALHLDSANTIEEQVPITIEKHIEKRINRVN
jgi:KUP system potassium uptake protein